MLQECTGNMDKNDDDDLNEQVTFSNNNMSERMAWGCEMNYDAV